MIPLQLPFWNELKTLSGDAEYFDTEMYWMTVILVIISLIVIGMLLWIVYSAIRAAIDRKTATVEISTGRIVDKKYIGEVDSSGIGTGMVSNSSGGVGVGIVSTSQHQDEQFLVFVQEGNEVFKIKSNMQQFYTLTQGQTVKIENKIGGLTHKNINRRIL